MKINYPLLRQIILYGIIGGGSAFLDFLLFSLMYSNLGINKYIANGISVHAGIAMSFVLNRSFNFKKTDRVLFRVVSFYATGLFGLALSQGLLWLGGIFILDIVIVKFVSIFIVAAVQFVINKLVTFGR